MPSRTAKESAERINRELAALRPTLLKLTSRDALYLILYLQRGVKHSRADCYGTMRARAIIARLVRQFEERAPECLDLIGGGWR